MKTQAVLTALWAHLIRMDLITAFVEHRRRCSEVPLRLLQWRVRIWLHAGTNDEPNTIHESADYPDSGEQHRHLEPVPAIKHVESQFLQLGG